MKKLFYVIREGWNSANQSSLRSVANPANQFESRQLMLVGIAEAGSAEEAIQAVSPTCYNNQRVFAETNPRGIRGLTEAIRNFEPEESFAD